MIRDKRFYELVMEMVQEHEDKSQKYAGASSDPLDNWNEIVFMMPAWKGCFARMTEKWARLKNVFGLPTLNYNEAYEILKEVAVYATIVRELLEREAESKS